MMISPTEATSTTLAALAPRYAAIVEAMIEAGGDLSDAALAEQLDAVEEAFGEKVERCEMVFRHLVAEAKAAAEFAAPWLERAKRREAAAERLKRYVFLCMQAAGTERVETPLGGARIQKNSQPSVGYTGDAANLPSEWQRVTVDLARDKVLAAHKSGQPIPDGVTVETGKHLRWL